VVHFLSLPSESRHFDTELETGQVKAASMFIGRAGPCRVSRAALSLQSCYVK
jgi:hypothetical protein